MSHLYGAAWLPALMAVILVRDGLTRPAFRNAALVGGGFILICLPWILWVGTNPSDYFAQMRTVGLRFDLFAPGFYASNVFSSDGPISMAWLFQTVRGLPVERVGSSTLAIGVPLATVLLLRRGRARSDSELALTVAAAVQFALFVVFLQVKSINYTIAIQIPTCIPEGSLVLGFQHYWLGLHDFPYRTWLLPLNMTNPSFEAKPKPSHPFHYLAVGCETYRAHRSLVPRCVVRDPTYGTMEIYEVRSRLSEATQ
jgi:hypothetical protein